MGGIPGLATNNLLQALSGVILKEATAPKHWLLEGFKSFIQEIKKEPLDLLDKVFKGIANQQNSNGETVIDSWLTAKAKRKADKVANLIIAKNTIEDIINTKK